MATPRMFLAVGVVAFCCILSASSEKLMDLVDQGETSPFEDTQAAVADPRAKKEALNQEVVEEDEEEDHEERVKKSPYYGAPAYPYPPMPYYQPPKVVYQPMPYIPLPLPKLKKKIDIVKTGKGKYMHKTMVKILPGKYMPSPMAYLPHKQSYYPPPPPYGYAPPPMYAHMYQPPMYPHKAPYGMPPYHPPAPYHPPPYHAQAAYHPYYPAPPPPPYHSYGKPMTYKTESYEPYHEY